MREGGEEQPAIMKRSSASVAVALEMGAAVDRPSSVLERRS